MDTATTQVSVTRTCPCRPDFTWKTNTTYTRHFSNETHKKWVTANERKDAMSRSKEFENEIERLRHKLEHKEQVEKQLLARISFLEAQLYI